jgi:hypothetical protein
MRKLPFESRKGNGDKECEASLDIHELDDMDE